MRTYGEVCADRDHAKRIYTATAVLSVNKGNTTSFDPEILKFKLGEIIAATPWTDEMTMCGLRGENTPAKIWTEHGFCGFDWDVSTLSFRSKTKELLPLKHGQLHGFEKWLDNVADALLEAGIPGIRNVHVEISYSRRAYRRSL